MMAQGYDKSLGAAMSGFEAEQKRNLEGGRLTGGLGQTVGGLGSKLVDAGSSYGTLGGTSADVGRVYSAMTPADMGFMYGLGQTQRDYDQRVLDNQRREACAALSKRCIQSTTLTVRYQERHLRVLQVNTRQPLPSREPTRLSLA